MADNFVGQIIPVGFTFAPPGYLMCDGSLQSIASYETLFALIGTTYGGDGVSTFALPDLRGCVALHAGNSGSGTFPLGQRAGTESVILSSNQNAMHTHPIAAQSGYGNLPTPANNVFAGSQTVSEYGTTSPNTTAPLLGPAGVGQAHENRMPSVAINYMIAVYGVYPSPS